MGVDYQQYSMFSYISAEQPTPKDHPLRAIRMTDAALRELSPRFEQSYAATGRPSIAPEKPLSALLLWVLYTVSDERLLMEQLAYDFLFRRFVTQATGQAEPQAALQGALQLVGRFRPGDE
jgi:transposase